MCTPVADACWYMAKPLQYCKVKKKERKNRKKEIKTKKMKINPDHSLEGLMLKLKLQYSSHLMWRADSLEKTLMLGKIEGKRMGYQKMWWLNSITNSMDMNLNKCHEIVKDGGSLEQYSPWVAKSRTGLSEWTTTVVIETTCIKIFLYVEFNYKHCL